jgi:DNA glycosylase AlkZ-like
VISMDTAGIAQERLYQQSISDNRFKKPSDVVAWFGAVQAQDFAAAKWALGLRMRTATDQIIEAAFDKGEILRTHVMRPTWHFVTPEDIRWLLALTAPRVHAFNGYQYRRSGLGKAVFKRSNTVIEKALAGGKQLTRQELDRILRQAGIPTENLGLSYTLMQAELDGIICSGPRRGKQFTYMLLDERVPKVEVFDRDQALATLTMRYFSSHGPAQLQDLVWWSGLTTAQVKRGLEMNKAHLAQEVVDGKSYWFTKSTRTERAKPQQVFLLPGFDEYFIAYKDRTAILDPEYSKHLNQGGGMVNGAVVVGGKMVGGWKRVLKSNGVNVSVQCFETIADAQSRGIKAAVDRYAAFLDLPILSANVMLQPGR